VRLIDDTSTPGERVIRELSAAIAGLSVRSPWTRRSSAEG